MNERFFYDALERRTKRLVSLVELSAPSHLINIEVMLVVRAAINYSPQNAKELVSWLNSMGCKDDNEDKIEDDFKEVCQC